MPRIQQYESRVGAQGEAPQSRAIVVDSGLGNAGAAIQSAANSLYDVAQRAEVSEVHTRLAKARAEWTVAMDDRARKTDPGDVTFADRFSKDLNDYMAKAGEGIRTAAGQAAFKQGSGQLSAHFFEKAGIYQAQAAGAKAKQDFLQSVDAGRNTLLTDPTQFDQVLKQNTDALNDPNGPYARLGAAERAELARRSAAEIALSAVQGAVRRNPSRAAADLNGGKWDQYLDADRKAAALQHADIAIKAQAADAERRAAQGERAQRREQMKVMDDVVRKMVDGEATAEMIRDANLDPGTKLRLVEMVRKEALQGEKIKTDPGVYLDVFQRIHAPENDPRKIRDENVLNDLLGNGLTLSNIRDLRGEVQGRRTTEGGIEADLRNGVVNMAKAALTGTNSMLGTRDPKGDEQLQRFMSYFLPEYAKQRQAGKTANQLLDPDSPDYLGKAVDRFRRSPQQMLKDMAASMTGAGAPAPTGTASDKPGTGTLEDPVKITTLPPEKERVVGHVYNFKGTLVEWVGGAEGWKRR